MAKAFHFGSQCGSMCFSLATTVNPPQYYYCMSCFGLLLTLNLPLGSILGESERRLMFSAIIAALDASQVEVPAFVSASPSTSISQSLEVLGYMIMSPRQAEITLHSQDSLITTGPQVVHYECQTLSSVSNKHPFFYLDGLMRMFGAKLWKFSRGS